MIGQIFINGADRLQIGTRELTSGDSLQVLVLDDKEQPRWEHTTVEHNGKAYYLTGLTANPVGLYGKL